MYLQVVYILLYIPIVYILVYILVHIPIAICARCTCRWAPLGYVWGCA